MTADCMEPFQQTTDRNIKLCVLTGATSGIGKAAALQLCKFNTQLILLSRNISKGNALVNKINNFYGPEKARFIQTDISNFAQVRSAANNIKEQHSGIDILINNAGARFNNFQENADGIELTFATNHLGHFLLTRMLLNLLEASPEGRIINVRLKRIADTVLILIIFSTKTIMTGKRHMVDQNLQTFSLPMNWSEDLPIQK